MITSTSFQHGSRQFLRTLAVACVLCLTATAARSQIIVDAVFTPLGGSVRYDLTIHNQSAEDVALVSILNAPLLDPLIDPSLTTPPGFISNYDDGLGIIDFLEDTDNFGAGESISGFSFESLAFPDANSQTFEALGIFGTTFTGSVQFTPGNIVVPEAGTTLAAFGLVAGILLHLARRYVSHP